MPAIDRTPFAPPVAGRPHMPGYGISESAEGMLSWEWVTDRLAASKNYWIVTASQDGRPHAMPVWGVWSEDALYFSTGRQTRKARNLAGNPRLAVHLESGDDAVMLEGEAEDLTEFSALSVVDDAYAAKYPNPETGEGFRIIPAGGNDSGVYRLRPRVVMAWRESDFPTSATRWRFPA